jgi:hypothetical protein
MEKIRLLFIDSNCYIEVSFKAGLTVRWRWGLLCIRSTRLVDFYSDSSLKQQSACKHVAPLGHIILIPSQPVFALSP